MKTTHLIRSLLVVISLTAVGMAAVQQVSVGQGTGYGTTGIYARTFGTVVSTMGTAIKYVPDVRYQCFRSICGVVQRWRYEQRRHRNQFKSTPHSDLLDNLGDRPRVVCV
jgi:hypothetical protein